MANFYARAKITPTGLLLHRDGERDREVRISGMPELDAALGPEGLQRLICVYFALTGLNSRVRRTAIEMNANCWFGRIYGKAQSIARCADHDDGR